MRLTADRRGSIAVIVALVAVPMILMTGLAIDTSRIYLLRQRLQTVVDASVILAAKEMSLPARNADAQALFWSNFGRQWQITKGQVVLTNVGFLGASTNGAAVITIDSTHVQINAQATLPMTFMALGGYVNWTVSASATAQSAGGIEMAMVLDVSGSMLDAAGTNNETKEQAVQQAASDALTTLYGAGNDTVPNLSVAVVPFQSSVSLGGARTSWLAAGAYSASNYAPQGWRGCVEARQNGEDATEDNPLTAPFIPYRWASTYHAYSHRSGNQTEYYSGDNDWTTAYITNTNPPGGTPYGGLTVGPNLGCPMTSVLPLTASKAAVQNAVNAMVAISGGSTLINLGLQAGWFTISPKWQGYWGNPAAPLAYGTSNNHKAIILFTDGNNEWDHNNALAPESLQIDAYYTAYGRASQNRLNVAMPTGNIANAENILSPAGGTSTGTLAAALDAKTLAICTAIKNNGITIYTIGFQADQDAINLLRGCATNPLDFFNSQNGNDIESAFQQIAEQLSALRLTQ